MIAVDFPEGDSATALQDRRQAAVADCGDAAVIVFTDILGGMPFRTAALLAAERGNMEVVCGTNVQLLVEAVLERHDDDTPLTLLERILPGAREGLNVLTAIKPRASLTPDAGNGI